MAITFPLPLVIDISNEIVRRMNDTEALGAANGGTNLVTVPEGALLLGDSGNAWEALAIGAAGKYLYSNGTTAVWADAATNDSTCKNANAGSLVPGTPVYQKAVASEVDKARANALATSRVLGLATATIATTANGVIRKGGDLTLTTGEWDAVIVGGSGGLVPGTRYYADKATAGKLVTATDAAAYTTGDFYTYVGIARTTTTMHVDPKDPVGL